MRFSLRRMSILPVFPLENDTSAAGMFTGSWTFKQEADTWPDYQIEPEEKPTGNRKERRTQASRDRKARKRNR